MTNDKVQQAFDDVIKHITDARALLKKLRKPVVDVLTEGAAFYEAARKPLVTLNDVPNKRQSERLFDLIKNVGLDSQDAVRVLEMDSWNNGAMFEAIGKALNGGIMHDFVIPMVMNAVSQPPGDTPKDVS